jgi:nicotinate dehydrogenase subunit B
MQSANKWSNPFAARRRVFATLGALCVAAVGIGAAVLPWRAIAPISRPDASVYSATTIARGAQLAALGDCAVCHTSENGIVNAGGRPIETPFGTIYSTNITPDEATGTGAWSYPAFERAMREGIHRDGRHLYPAFPYTHFAKTSDADLQALYAYLMAQKPVQAKAPDNKLRFPFNLRPLMAGWNASSIRPRRSNPTRANRKSGIAAPISSKVSAIALPATHRAMRFRRRKQTPISPVGLRRAGKRRH